mmetsp:Transcript_42744/g.101474  ORF Transcript_42744/g.101474 Transcript_42744/m.101474 type:complete len:89 (+) Transcript_42744:135-401(+)
MEFRVPMQHVLAYVENKDRLRLAQVCKDWNQVVFARWTVLDLSQEPETASRWLKFFGSQPQRFPKLRKLKVEFSMVRATTVVVFANSV